MGESQDLLYKKSTSAKQIFIHNGLFFPNWTGLQNDNQNKKKNPAITGLHPFLCILHIINVHILSTEKIE